MIGIPNPLHPAIAHFPIAFIIVGTLFSLVTLFTQKWNLSWFAAGLLTIGALGTIGSVVTGEQAGKAVGNLPSLVENHVEEHEEWGEQTRLIAIIAALLAILAASLGRFPKLSWSISALAAIAALIAAFNVYRTAHSGSQLVYNFGLGVKINPTAPTATSPEIPDKDSAEKMELQKHDATENPTPAASTED